MQKLNLIGNRNLLNSNEYYNDTKGIFGINTSICLNFLVIIVASITLSYIFLKTKRFPLHNLGTSIFRNNIILDPVLKFK